MSSEMQCYNKGCGKQFSPEENGSEACIYHPGAPVFHDAYKGWSCCKKRTTDFTEFLNIPGCAKGAHNTEKPLEVPKSEFVLSSDKHNDEDFVAVAPKERKPVEPIQRPSENDPMTRLAITVGASLKSALAKLSLNKPAQMEDEHKTGINKVETGTPCKNKACEKEYLGETSDNETCKYHSGKAIFHEGMKYWSCCERKTSDFNNFLQQEGCTSGKHVWVLSEDDAMNVVACRHDWHQTGSHVVLSVYCKNSDPDNTTLEANQVALNVNITFDGGNSRFQKRIILEGPIDPTKSRVNMLGAKVEVKLKKSELFSWKRYELEPPADPSEEEEEEEFDYQ